MWSGVRSCCKITTSLCGAEELVFPSPIGLTLAGGWQGADCFSRSCSWCLPVRNDRNVSPSQGSYCCVQHSCVAVFPCFFGENCQLQSCFWLWMLLWPLVRSLENKVKLRLFILPALLKPRGARLTQPSSVSSSSLCARWRQDLSLWHAALGREQQAAMPHPKAKGHQGGHLCLWCRCHLSSLFQASRPVLVVACQRLIGSSHPMLPWEEGLKDKAGDSLRRADQCDKVSCKPCSCTS